ncbi:hypothetical protein BH24ACT5_BH24ACT5_10530 [soil metagenome]
MLSALVLVVAGSLWGGQATTDHLGSWTVGGVRGTLQAAGLLFFAFAGYARIATLGEEVVDPARTIPRAIPTALAITLTVYATVATAALLAAGPEALATSDAPLATAVRAGSLDVLVPVVRVGGTVAALGVLLSVIVGISRTGFAMASRGDLPRWLDAVHHRHRVPHRAELVVGVVVTAIVTVADVRHAIGFSSFCVLVYYAIANASAFTMRNGGQVNRATAVAGIAGCALLAAMLPAASVIGGLVVLIVGVMARVAGQAVRADG